MASRQPSACKHCGYATHLDSDPKGYCVRCMGCGIRTRLYTTEAEAIEVWDRRAEEALIDTELAAIVKTRAIYLLRAMPKPKLGEIDWYGLADDLEGALPEGADELVLVCTYDGWGTTTRPLESKCCDCGLPTKAIVDSGSNRMDKLYAYCFKCLSTLGDPEIYVKKDGLGK